MSDIKRIWGGGGGGGGGATASKYNHSQIESSTASGVSTSSKALEPSRVEDELIRDWQNQLWALPHPTSTSCHYTYGEFSQAFPVFITLTFPCIVVNANQKRDRPGDEATNQQHPGITMG